MDKVKMYTSADNGAEILLFPVAPENLPEIEDEFGHEEFETNESMMTLIGQRKRKKLTLELFLPVFGFGKYRFIESGAVSGEKYIDFWNRRCKEEIPMRLIIIKGGKTILNMAYTIDSLKHYWTHEEDIRATVEISEYIFDEDLVQTEEEEAYNWTSVKIRIDGTGFTVTGANVNGYWLLPVREILENAGYVVNWVADEKKITYTKDGKTAEFSGAFEIYNGTSYSYARDIAAALKWTVNWVNFEVVYNT